MSRMSPKIRSDKRKFFQEVKNLFDDLPSFETFWDSLFFKKVKLLKQGSLLFKILGYTDKSEKYDTTNVSR